MASNKICVHCENFHLAMIEKEKEIEMLELHIQNLTNYLLWKDKSTLNLSNINDEAKLDLNDINKTEVKEEKFYSSDLFIKSCDILKKCIILESKSIQTQITGNSNNFNDIGEINEIPQYEVGNLHDYVYDKNYQMYYSLSTGYFYDDKSGLMYEPQSCTYYRYDYTKKEYEKISQEESLNCEEASSYPFEDRKENGYMCETVVDQVNNLNLNDESTKIETSRIKNSIKSESCANENENENCNMINLETSEEDVSLGCAKDWQPTEGSQLTVTDMVRQVVDEHNNVADYIYDEAYQMYYSSSTGYFYDAVRKLLYDPTSGIYYFYDADKQAYEFYCQTDPNTVDTGKSVVNEVSVDKERLTYRKLYWKKKLEYSRQISGTLSPDENKHEKDSEDFEEEFSSPEDGEIFSSDDEGSNVPVSIVKSPIKGPCLSMQKCADDSYPPSIRAIVENSENLQIGSLILITCSGGIIGRDKMNAVYVPDICVSKEHAEIKFNSDCQTYSIEDLGSQNGTFINDKRLSEPKVKSKPCTLSHGDKVSLGTFKLLLHIHDDHDTCDNCEPGQVLAEISSHIEKNAVYLSKEEKEKLRREELRRLKKKYGLQNAAFERKETSVTHQRYEDKAEIRRQTVGSDNPYEKTQEASIDVSMPKTNKGYQMLKKMGWKEGQTLGTADSGIVEPIPLRPWTSKAGLGSSVDPSYSVGNLPEDKRTQKWVKARERYFQLSLGSDVS